MFGKNINDQKFDQRQQKSNAAMTTVKISSSLLLV